MYNYTPEQKDLFDKKLSNQDTLGGFVTYDQSERIYIRKGGQVFAVFGNYAYELIHQRIDDDGWACEYLPVVIDGNAFGEFPDEGRSGILHLMRVTKWNGEVIECPEWQASYLSCGWLLTRELALSAEQIAENIIAEIDAGANHITGYQHLG